MFIINAFIKLPVHDEYEYEFEHEPLLDAALVKF